MAENDKIIELLKTLVNIKSPSKKEEKIKRFVKNYLINLGYKVHEEKYYIATESDSDLIVATHLDTVPLNYNFFLIMEFMLMEQGYVMQRQVLQLCFLQLKKN